MHRIPTPPVPDLPFLASNTESGDQRESGPVFLARDHNRPTIENQCATHINKARSFL
jgi:hypothetical protein